MPKPAVKETAITVTEFVTNPRPAMDRARHGQVTHIVGADGEVYVLGLNGVRHLPPPEFDLPDLDLFEAALAQAPKTDRWLR